MKTFAEHARLIREVTHYDTETTLRKVTRLLALNGIPHYVCGGFAVQEHGYPRFTPDIDLVVPNTNETVEYLVHKNHLFPYDNYKQNPIESRSMIDLQTNVIIDFHLGGSIPLGWPKSIIPLPKPVTISSEPNIISLEKLISLKLSLFMSFPVVGMKDAADVVELIKANRPPLNLNVDNTVRKEYDRIWKSLML